MAWTHRAIPTPSPPSTTRQRASSAQVPSDSPSQATRPQGQDFRPRRVIQSSTPEPPIARALTDFELPSNMSPESIIRRPMVTASPIEGNSDYRVRPFHSELYFDQESSIRLLPIHDYSWCPSPTVIPFTIDGRHGILEARHIAEALQIPFEPVDPSAFY
ncbi:hypothetical protein CK203_044945 [Vitis vinifera]|uniref:Uncharacterized protein n=1 Tax=Vitis vinifera TaxID=29760 RepID=A0A438HFI3_VITVI|nr:hypothetical protein CK203_044945 [Vitis vinifera]